MLFPSPSSFHPPGPGARAAPSSAARAAAPVAAAATGGRGTSLSPAGDACSSLGLGVCGVEGRTGASAADDDGFASPFKPRDCEDDDDSNGSLAATLAARDRGPLVRKDLLDLGPFSSARGGEGGRRWWRAGGGCGGGCCCCAEVGAAADDAPPARCCSSIPLESALAVRRNLHDLPPILSRDGEGSEEAARPRAAAGRGLISVCVWWRW